MRTPQFRAALDLKGTSIPKLAEEHGFSHQAFTNVTSGRCRSARIERIVADAMGLPLHVAFPNYYTAPKDYQEPEKVEISKVELLEIRNQLVKATSAIDARLCIAA